MSSQEKLSDLDLAWVNVVVEISKKLDRVYQAELLICVIAKKEGVTNVLDRAKLSNSLWDISDILQKLSDEVYGELIVQLYRLLYSQTYTVNCRVGVNEFNIKDSFMDAVREAKNDVKRSSNFHTGGYINPQK